MYVATRYVTILPDDANYPRYGGPVPRATVRGRRAGGGASIGDIYIYTAPGAARMDARARRGFGWMPFEF